MPGTQDAGYRRPTLQHRHIRRSRLLIAGSATASSSKGLSQCNSRATIYGQIAVVLVLVLLAYFMAAMMYRAVKEYGALPESDIIFIMVIMLSIAATAFFLQFAVPDSLSSATSADSDIPPRIAPRALISVQRSKYRGRQQNMTYPIAIGTRPFRSVSPALVQCIWLGSF